MKKIQENITTITVTCALLLIAALLLYRFGRRNNWFDTPETKGQVAALKPGQLHEICLPLAAKQRLTYSFQASHTLKFNIHYHEKKRLIYPTAERELAAGGDELIAPEDQSYCLLWENTRQKPATVNYHYETEDQTADDRIPVFFRTHTDRKTIQIVDAHGGYLAEINVGRKILNFALNSARSRLVVLTAEAAHVYRIQDYKRLAAIKTPFIARLLAFSHDDRTLALANEHELEVLMLDLSDLALTGRVTLPAPALRLDGGEALLVRTASEIVKIGFDSLEIIERDAKIPVEFGGELIYVNPSEWCFEHGIPHPLFFPPVDAMGPQGLPTRILVSRFERLLYFLRGL